MYASFASWWYGSTAVDTVHTKLFAEMKALPLFQQRQALCSVGYRVDAMCRSTQRLIDCFGGTMAMQKAAYAAVMTHLTTDEGRLFVRSYPQLSKAVFENLLVNKDKLALDVEMRQLFPSAPPMTELGPDTVWQPSYCILPLA